MTRREAVTVLLAALVGGALPACAGGIPVLHYDRDTCAHCRMTLSDRRFGAAARLPSGQILRFDTIDCLLAWQAGALDAPVEIWLVDALTPGTLRPLGSVAIHRDTTLTSPMGQGYLAVDTSHADSPWTGATIPWETLQAGGVVR